MTGFDWIVFSIPAMIVAFFLLGPGLKMLSARFGKGGRTIFGLYTSLCFFTVAANTVLLSDSAKADLSDYITMSSGLGIIMSVLFLWEFISGSIKDKE